MATESSKRRSLGGWLAVLGIAGLIVYVLYVLKWSGNDVEALDLAKSGESSTHVVELEPAMSPVRAVLETRISARDGRAFDYEVSIRGKGIDGVKMVLDDSGDMRVGDKGDSSSSGRRDRGANVNLGTFDVPAAGEYAVSASLDPFRSVIVNQARVVLTANTATFDARVIGGLVLLMLAGLALGVQWRKGGEDG